MQLFPIVFSHFFLASFLVQNFNPNLLFPPCLIILSIMCRTYFPIIRFPCSLHVLLICEISFFPFFVYPFRPISFPGSPGGIRITLFYLYLFFQLGCWIQRVPQSIQEYRVLSEQAATAYQNVCVFCRGLRSLRECESPLFTFSVLFPLSLKFLI